MINYVFALKAVTECISNGNPRGLLILRIELYYFTEAIHSVSLFRAADSDQ